MYRTDTRCVAQVFSFRFAIGCRGPYRRRIRVPRDEEDDVSDEAIAPAKTLSVSHGSQYLCRGNASPEMALGVSRMVSQGMMSRTAKDSTGGSKVVISR